MKILLYLCSGFFLTQVMKKNFLCWTNALLGLVSVWLAGCRTQRPPEVMYGGPMPRKYGPPVEVVTDEGQILTPEQTQPVPVEPKIEPVVCKYGVPVERELK